MPKEIPNALALYLKEQGFHILEKEIHSSLSILTPKGHLNLIIWYNPEPHVTIHTAGLGQTISDIPLHHPNSLPQITKVLRNHLAKELKDITQQCTPATSSPKNSHNS